MIETDGERYRLTIPISDAIEFAIGRSDLTYADPSEELRQLVALLAMDALEYTEQWRAAAYLRGIVKLKWPRLLRESSAQPSDEDAA
jgi:hypothetical protein